MERTASTTVSSVVTALQSIADLGNKVFPILSQADVDAVVDKIPFPAVGVVYGGIEINDKVPRGAAGKIFIDIAIAYKVEAILGQAVGQTYQMKALDLLDAIRATMFALKGPNGKDWMLESELPPIQSGVITQWVQRWALPIILT